MGPRAKQQPKAEPQDAFTALCARAWRQEPEARNELNALVFTSNTVLRAHARALCAWALCTFDGRTRWPMAMNQAQELTASVLREPVGTRAAATYPDLRTALALEAKERGAEELATRYWQVMSLTEIARLAPVTKVVDAEKRELVRATVRMGVPVLGHERSVTSGTVALGPLVRALSVVGSDPRRHAAMAAVLADFRAFIVRTADGGL